MHRLRRPLLAALILLFAGRLGSAADLGARADGPGRRTPLPFVPVVEEGAPEDVRLPRRTTSDWTRRYPETGITYLEYVASRPQRPTDKRHTIYLLPLGDFRDRQTLEPVRRFVQAYFRLPAKVLAPRPLPAGSYDDERRRYDADDLLLSLESGLPRDAFICTAITRADLFCGRLRSVFGLSYCDLRSSVVSTARIWAEPRRAAGGDERLRLAKLVVHEIAHNLGLPHCAAHACRMNGTMGLRDVDRAPTTLCGPCLKKLAWNIGFDRLRRYRALHAALEELDADETALALRGRIRRLATERLYERDETLAAARRLPRRRDRDEPLALLAADAREERGAER